MAKIRGIKVKPLRAITLDDRGALSRARLAPNTAPDQCIDMLQVFEALDGLVIPLPGGRGHATLKQDVQGLPTRCMARTYYDDANRQVIIQLDNKTYAGLRRGEGWARFTLPHEIGHAREHLAELVELTELPHAEIALTRANPQHRVFEDSEWQSDRFAAAFLAPDEGLAMLHRCGRLAEEHVMRVYGMARSTARYRIHNYWTAMRQRARLGWRS